MVILVFTLTALSIYFGIKHLSSQALLNKLLHTASHYPLARCHSRYHVGLLYGHLHALTDAAGLSALQRHRLAARALDLALLYPASRQLSAWIQHNCKDTIQGWYTGKQFAEQRKSNWNKDDREFLELFD